MDSQVKAAIRQYQIQDYTWRLSVQESRVLQDLIDVLDEDQYKEYDEATRD